MGDELTWEQRVAVRVCTMRGQDPLERVRISHPDGKALATWGPRWRQVLQTEVGPYLTIQAAIDEENRLAWGVGPASRGLKS